MWPALPSRQRPVRGSSNLHSKADNPGSGLGIGLRGSDTPLRRRGLQREVHRAGAGARGGEGLWMGFTLPLYSKNGWSPCQVGRFCRADPPETPPGLKNKTRPVIPDDLVEYRRRNTANTNRTRSRSRDTIVTSRGARNCARHPCRDQRLPLPERPDAVGAAGCLSDPQDGVSPGLRSDRPHHVRQPGDGVAAAAGRRHLHRPKPETRTRCRSAWPSRWSACCCSRWRRPTA